MGLKYVRRTSKDIKENFLMNLLIDRRILTISDDLKKFFYPSIENEYPSAYLDNIDEGYEMFLKHLKAGNSIYLIIDPDVDGYTSGAILYSYLQQKEIQEKFPNFSITYHTPQGKSHGLEEQFEYLSESKKYDLIILPDSSSNDYEYHEILKKKGYDILVIDHHKAEKYSDNAIVINNQLSKNYPNKDLSGVGVVYKFLEYCDANLNLDLASQFLDLVALGQISDMMKMNGIENRWILKHGLSNINNKFFKELLSKQSFSLGEGPLDQIGIAFYIAPLINALIRVGSDSEKEKLFIAFIKPDLMVDSTKRGEKGLQESICTQSVRNCVNAKSRQNREKDKAIELLDIQISNDCLSDNKILILDAEDTDVSTSLTGLCAMGIAAKYKKPTLLGRVSSDGYLRGSIRGREDSELKDFRNFLLSSGYMEYVEG